MWRDDPRDHEDGRMYRSRGGATSGRHADADCREVFARDLDLPRGPERECVLVRTRIYDLRASEVRTLATAGSFRVVLASDLRDQNGRALDARMGDLRHLRETGLVRTTPYVMARPSVHHSMRLEIQRRASASEYGDGTPTRNRETRRSPAPCPRRRVATPRARVT